MLRQRDRGAERGVILEIAGEQAIVLTRAGEFRRVRLDRPDRQVGEEIRLPSPVLWLPSLSPALVAVAAAAVLLVALLPATLLRAPTGPSASSVAAPGVLAYVSVDINPSFELGVDASARVVSAKALNADAVPILEGVAYAGREVSDVIASLAQAAAARGYLAPGRENAVVIAAVPSAGTGPVPEVVRRQVDAGRRRVETLLAERAAPGQVGLLVAESPALREQAEQAGLSVGKYLILLEARQEGVQVTAEEVRSQPIGRLFQEHGVKPGEIIRRAEEEKAFEKLAERYREVPEGKGGEGEDRGIAPGRAGGAGKPGARPGEREQEGKRRGGAGGLAAPEQPGQPEGARDGRGKPRERGKDRQREGEGVGGREGLNEALPIPAGGDGGAGGETAGAVGTGTVTGSGGGTGGTETGSATGGSTVTEPTGSTGTSTGSTGGDKGTEQQKVEEEQKAEDGHEESHR